MIDFCVYLFYRAALALVVSLPVPVVFALGKFLGGGAWLILPKYRRLARHNLRIAFGDTLSAADCRRIVRRHFQNLGANLLSGAKLSSLTMEEAARYVTFEGVQEVRAIVRGGRPAVFALSHLSNWELFAQLMPHLFPGLPLSTVYQALRNRWIDEFVRRQRTRFGVRVFERSGGFQEAIRLLRTPGLIGILSDQHAGDAGMWTPFFGRLASTTPLPAVLCKRTGAALISAAIYTAGRGRWRMVFGPALDRPNDSIEELTARANVAIAEEIRRSPEDWFWVHNRWKTPKPNWLLSEYKRGLFVPDNEPLQPFRILIRASNWLGDAIISMPAVRAIKRGRPDAQVTILTPEKTAAVWRLLPEVDAVVSLGKMSLGRVARELRKEGPFDVGIVFPNSLRSTLELWLGKIPRRVGFAGHHRSWLLNQIVRPVVRNGPPPHQVEHYLDLARSLGVKINAAEIATAVPTRRLDGEKKFGLCPGAEYGPAKRWLPERFAETAAAIGGRWILFGTAKDAEIGAQIASALGGNCENRIGRTTLEELIAGLRECELLLTNDTGTMHLATLLGVPVVAVFGSTEPTLTGPLGTRSTVVRHQVECSPCFLRECPLDFRCMKAVTAEEVAETIREQVVAPATPS